MTGIDLKIKGVQKLKTSLREIANRVPQKAAAAIYQEANAVMTTAKKTTIPVNLGSLRNSGRVSRPKIQGSNIIVEITFGDTSAPYALAVHEHPSEHSPPSWQGKPIGEILSVRERTPWSLEGRGPKYLERPLNEAIKGMAERIAEKIGGLA